MANKCHDLLLRTNRQIGFTRIVSSGIICTNKLSLVAQLVEQPAVNRFVVGSSPT
jgi:hypothetical protein